MKYVIMLCTLVPFTLTGMKRSEAQTATVQFTLPLCTPREKTISLALGDDGTSIEETLPNFNGVIKLSATISLLPVRPEGLE